MQVRHDEGLAIHIGPKPCVAARKDGSEASAGECAGQPSSPEKILSRTSTFLRRRKATLWEALLQAPCRSGVVGDPGMHRRSLLGNREIPRPTIAALLSWSVSGR